MSTTAVSRWRVWLSLFLVSLRLGVTSFGGPAAHLGFFHEEYVRRKKWLDEKTYADVVALCQFLPGPASSQVGMAVGLTRGGIIGGLASFAGFTLPSVFLLIGFAYMYTEWNLGDAGWIHGLKLVAVAVVAHAVFGMAKKLTPDVPRQTIAVLSLAIILLWQTAWSQVIVILLAAIAGIVMFRKTASEASDDQASRPLLTKRAGAICLTLFVGFLIAFPLLRNVMDASWLALSDMFYRAGSFVFGGGHVVLPLLEREFV
ncbi:chromate efflux transporter, partial [Bacillaceae bacterium SIJ1]|uniref:chromate efflux transporter n=1 Tax=Litoribacterium kuwaitense TaxID=1398745 RepID=UPI0013EBCBC5